jgi:hypothetical protein
MNIVISEDVAVQSVLHFVNHHSSRPKTEEEIKEEFEDVVSAVMYGQLVLDDLEAPRMMLREPIVDEKGAVDKSEILFKTRVKPSTYEVIGRGLDLKKQSIRFGNLLTAHLCGFETAAYLDKLDKFDYKTVQQLTGLFT